MTSLTARFTIFFDRTIGRRFYPLHRALYRLTGGLIGRRSPLGPILLLTTVGRKSGQRRTTPLLYMPDEPRLVVVGSNAGRQHTPAWVLNLVATPMAEVQVGRRTMEVDAHLLTDEEKELMWPRLLAHYKGWGEYQELTAREIRVIALVPRPGPSRRARLSRRPR
jgi:deazaflavin-dependent oxidoreductase (nitroreductase family)